MAKAKKEVAKAKQKKVACFECNKKFKNEAAMANHASAKKHRRNPLVPKAAPPVPRRVAGSTAKASTARSQRL
ncbi:uncharacterized protein TRAVEDRAFT_30380, partial [Trametes versicolor FP-101664 SS1]|uniref:uncharacterized protein n=1 Tax=Trametes versicolor (strain FP-101664) TaxID=717944 RepID=UPI0004624541